MTNNKLNLRPLSDCVMVEPKEKEEKTAKEKPQESKIWAAGPGLNGEDGKRIEMDVKNDDGVLFAEYTGTQIKIDDKKLLIIEGSDIKAIVE
jgi:chaperonin GroES